MSSERLITLMRPDKVYSVKALASALVQDHLDVISELERLKRFGFVRESSERYSLTTAGVRLREILITRPT